MILSENQISKTAVASKIVILIGDDRLTVEKKITTLFDIDLDHPFSELNTTRLDASATDFNDISMQLNMFPLGGGKRIVILDNAVDVLNKKGAKEWLDSVLVSFSPTTMLVMLIEDKWKYKNQKWDWETISSNHWLRKLSSQFSGDLTWFDIKLPSEKEMPAWIQKEANDQGGEFDPKAAVELSRLVGNDLFQVRQEIEKCVMYVGPGKRVGADDVRLLCAASHEDDIFALVDAIGTRNGKLAISLLNKLNIDMPIQFIFSMMVRQIRLLILAKESLLSGGKEKEIMTACDTRFAFVAKKLTNQARHFEMGTLEEIYRELDQIDEHAKMGNLSLDASLDRLIAKISAN